MRLLLIFTKEKTKEPIESFFKEGIKKEGLHCKPSFL
jgi:hypothetical protein